MTDLVADQKFISQESTKHKAANSEALIQDIGGSLNWASASYRYALGDILESFATEAQFQTQFGTGWKLCDGQSIAGSDLDTLITLANAPDCRGKFVRGLDNGRGTDPARVVNTTQAKQNKDHTHAMFANTTANTNGVGAITLPFIARTLQNNTTNYRAVVSPTGSQWGVVSTSGDEAKPRNIAVNFFIKVNN